MLRSILQNSTAGFYIFASDSTTPTSGKTGLTITTTLSKAGGTANSVSPTITEIGNGLYWVAPIAAHRDTLGEIAWQFSGTGAIIAPRLEKVVAVDDQTTAFGAVKPTTAGRTVTVDTSGQVTVGGYASGQAPLQPTVAGRTLAVDASGIVTDTAGTTTLLSRLTSTRAGLLDNLDVAISVIQSQITALNNLSAKANWFGSALLEIPDSGTRAYVFELVIKDDEDKLVNLDGLPTITLTNSAGTDRSSLITTGIANAATGRYTLTITVGTSTTNEALLLKATGTVSGETRYAVWATQVVDYDSGSIINSIYTTLGVPATSTIAGDIAAVKTVADTVAADTTTLKSRITSTLFSGITYMKNWMAVLMGKAADLVTRAEVNATTAGVGYNETTDSLEAIRDRGDAAWITGSSGSGTGARTVTITVNDGTTVLQNATVRLTEGTNSYTADTNASGVATFNVDDATYTVSITKSGYSYSGTTLVVDGTEAVTYSMTQIAITPGTGDLTTGYFTALDDEGTPEADVSIYVEMTKIPSGDTGYAFDSRVRTVTSAANGLVTIEGLIKGATYRIYRGKWIDSRYLIPTSVGSTYELPSIIGREQ